MNTLFTMYKAIETDFLMDAFNSTVFAYILLAGVSHSVIGFSGIITLLPNSKFFKRKLITHPSVAKGFIYK